MQRATPHSLTLLLHSLSLSLSLSLAPLPPVFLSSPSFPSFFYCFLSFPLSCCLSLSSDGRMTGAHEELWSTSV